MSSPVMKTPTKSERLKQIADTALKKLADSQKKQKDEIDQLREEMEAAMLMDDLETEAQDQEPSQLLSDLPLKEGAVSDSEEDQEAEELNQEAIDDDLMTKERYGKLYGSDEVVDPIAIYEEEERDRKSVV